ncbi:Gustatory receptor 28b [Culex quinquefasciatus]|uniref:Gustatory receptor n=1 Tax=Culex quinquefasciatus TaxID=7176 RepID=B0XFG8_CULQU|nr:Gustatory receptor 28b [Culex quinquefasciatus]|eukprot:XP_001868390.1 Gustatory receptor 28b [Culex quinquefasciatus]
MVANVLDAHRQITFPLKCVGLHPLVTEGRNRRQLHYRMMNCTLILASIGFYGYLLWNYSLDSEFFRLNSGKPVSLPTATSCLALFNLCCKLFGIIPLFTNLKREKTRRSLYLLLNYLGLAASMTAYVAILRMSFRETIVQVVNSSLMILIMEGVYRQYSIVGLVAVGQLLYEGVGKITTILDTVDRELAQAGNTGTLVTFDRLVHRLIAFGFLAPFLLLALGAVFLNSHVDVKPGQFLVIATNLYVQCSYAFLLLHPIVTVLAVSLRFRRVDETMSSTPRQNRVQLCACLLVCGILMAWNYDYRYWNKWNSPVVIMCGIVMQTVSFCEPTLAIVAGFLLKSKTQRLLLKLHHFDVQYQNLTKQAFNYRKQQSGIAIGFYGHIVISMCFMLSYNAFVNGLSELGLMTCLTLAYNLLHVIASRLRHGNANTSSSIKMLWFNVVTIYESLRPLYYPLKICGLAPGPFHRTKRRYRWRERLYAAVAASGYSWAFYVNFFMQNFSYLQSSSLIVVICYVFTVFLFLIEIFTVLRSVTVWPKVQRLFRKQHEVDQSLRWLNVPIDHAGCHRRLTVTIWAVLILLTAAVLVSYRRAISKSALGFSSTRLLTYLVQSLGHALVVGLPIVVVLLLKCRFRAVNDAFR